MANNTEQHRQLAKVQVAMGMISKTMTVGVSKDSAEETLLGIDHHLTKTLRLPDDIVAAVTR